jgi:hypothetical protein
MYKILSQKQGKLYEIEETDYIKQINLYKRGKYIFELNEKPKCKICGSDLEFIKKGKYLIINKCLNENCETNNINLKKGSPIKRKAFLPEYINEQYHQIHLNNNSFNIDYLINIKGYTYDEAIQYINEQKNNRKLNGQKNKGANKKEQYIKKYGEELGLQKIKENSCLRIEYWIKRGYSEQEAKEKISLIQQKNSNKVSNYGIVTKKYLESKNIDSDLFMKERSIYCIEYYIKRGYTIEQAKTMISKYQSNNSKRKKLDNIKIQSPRCLEYWLNICDNENIAKEMYKKFQTTFSKEICIQKYGKIEGLKRFKERQEKWQKTLHEKGNLHVGYSKISQILFNELKKCTNNEIYFGSLNKEYTIYNKENKHIYAYDFTDISNKKIIEFQGDIYHGNPLMFNENEYPNPWSNLTAKELWERDNYKKQIAINNGFDIIFIWENDFRKNKNNIINECKKFLGYE